VKVLVTGSGGFIGQHLVRILESQYLIIRHSRKKLFPAIKDNYFHLDVNGLSDWHEHLQDVDVIIHLAASAHNKSNSKESIDDVNVNGALAIARQAAMAGVKRFIFISSIGVLGNKTTVPFDENTAVSPHSEYAKSKLKAEVALLELARETTLEVVIIRPVLVYGDKAPGNFLKLKSLINKFSILPFGLVNNKRSFISIGNLVSFVQLCIEHPKAKNEIFCIADGKDISTKEFTNAIATALSKKIVQLPIPIWLMKYAGRFFRKKDMVEQLVGDLQVDVSKARRVLGWTPSETMKQAMDRLRVKK
jgi:nucleoside-diphosphate-sugar epimerase